MSLYIIISKELVIEIDRVNKEETESGRQLSPVELSDGRFILPEEIVTEGMWLKWVALFPEPLERITKQEALSLRKPSLSETI